MHVVPATGKDGSAAVPIGAVRHALAAWGLHDAHIVPLPGGEQKELWRCETGAARYVLRIYPSGATPDHVAHELTLTSALRASVPEVPDAHPTTAGHRAVTVGDRVAVLATFVEGGRPLRSAALRSATAGVLARIHASGAAHTPTAQGFFPAIAAFDWTSNRWWDARRISTRGHGHPLVDLTLARLEDVPDIVRRMHGLPTAIVHNDFHLGNLVASPDGAIKAVIDWDWATVDWRVLDIASGLRFFILSGEGGDIASAVAFLDAYNLAATCPLTDAERHALPEVLRLRATWTALYDLGRRDLDTIDADGITYRTSDLHATDGFAVAFSERLLEY